MHISERRLEAQQAKDRKVRQADVDPMAPDDRSEPGTDIFLCENPLKAMQQVPDHSVVEPDARFIRTGFDIPL